MVKKKNSDELILKVGSVNPDDANKGIVKIDSKIMSKIGLRPGDIVEIEGEKKTVGIVDRSYPGDIGLEIIKMDGITRRNAGTNMGENVKIKKAEVKEAKKITIAPVKKGIIVRANEEVLKRGLIGRVIVKGDFLSMGGRRRNTLPISDGTIFGELFKNLMSDEDFFGPNMSMGMGGLGGDILFMVVDGNPKNAPLIIGPETEITLNPEAVDIKQESIPDITYDDVGGLKDEILKVREMIELPLRHPEIFEKLGIEPPKGVLLHGPPGTGKTLLARAVASETNTHFITINGPEIMSKFYGESEKNLRAKFEEAEKNAPSIIFIDEIDAIAPKRGETQGDVERRVVAQLLSIMDGLKSRGKVVVIAATNRPNDIDPALRRPGRFDREIIIGVPDKEGRETILKIHSRNMPMDKNVKIKEIARVTHGFVGADLESLVKEAAMIVLRKVFPDLKNKKGKNEEEETISKELLEKLIIKQEDLINALKVVRPSAMREVLVEVPDLKWDDVGGLEKEKEKLKEMVEWPLKHPKSFTRLGISPPKGVLMYGPPGTGKTLMAKAVANESEANFILINGPELLSKWVGESEKAVRKIFKKARETSPTIIFFDEIDAIAPRRGIKGDSEVTERVVNQLLTEIDGIEDLTNVFVIAATNRPDILDPALLRPGRFDRIIFMDVPKKSERKAIFNIHTKNMPLAKDVNLTEIIANTEGYVGADIESVCREAAILAMREDMKAKEIKQKHFNGALNIVKPSVSKKVGDHYKKFEEVLHSARSEKILIEKPNYLG